MSLSNFFPNLNGLGGIIEISLNGQIVATWDATNENGNWVPNGTYYFVSETTDSNGNKVIHKRGAFVMTFHSQAVSLTALPNVAYPGETIHFFASFGASPADEMSSLKIYAVSGELVRVLTVSGGNAVWDLINRSGQMSASGIYLAVLDGTDPANGVPMRKTVKVMVIH